jgi:glycosyltransferase domain-containing protein
MRNSDILSRLTIICLTYNRHEFIRRQIAYFYDCPVNLRFMDGSKTSIKLDDTNLKTGQLKWNYQHFPDLNYYERLLLASEEVETEFICLLPDDDILFKTGLETAINNLDNCKDLQFGGGKVARIISLSNNIGFCRDYHWSDNLLISFEDISERLYKMISLKRTANIYYVVGRTAVFKGIYKAATKFQFSYASSIELIITGLSVINSKYITGDYPFWFRGVEPSIDQSLYSKGLNAQTWYTQYLDEVEIVRNIIGSALEEQEYSKYEALEISKKFLDIHHSQHLGISYVDVSKSPKYKSTLIISPILNLIKLIKSKIRFKYQIYKLLVKFKFIQNISAFIFGKEKLLEFLIIREIGIEQYNIKSKEYNPSDIIGFWKSQGVSLTEDQEMDLLNIKNLVEKFPNGIMSNEELFKYLKN